MRRPVRSRDESCQQNTGITTGFCQVYKGLILANSTKACGLTNTVIEIVFLHSTFKYFNFITITKLKYLKVE